jgi:predicted HTH transcriptional regulator
VDGVTFKDPEPRLWIQKVIRSRVRPIPLFEVKIWQVHHGKSIAVVKVKPVATPPCMTNGVIYLRVSGETVQITDPAQLSQLIREREQSMDRAGRKGSLAAARTPKFVSAP